MKIFKLLSLCFFSFAHNSGAADCELGDHRTEVVPCISGWMTFPSRTERCLLPERKDWYISQAAFGETSLGGTGGSMIISPNRTVGHEALQLISRHVNLKASAPENTREKTEQLNLIAKSLSEGMLPLKNATTVKIQVTLTPMLFNDPFCRDGNTTSNCPHVYVPPVSVVLICLPASEK